MKLTSLYYFLSKNRFLLPLGIIGMTIVTLVLTLIPADFLGESKIWSFDKVGHLVLFGGWTFLLGLYRHISNSSLFNIWGYFFIGFSFGLSVELLQHFLPLNRHGSFIDLLFDAFGCLLAVWMLKKTIPDELTD